MNKQKQIDLIYEELESKLGEDQIFVPGEGNPDAELMLVGEAPGAKETELRRPFVGKAGKNLDEFLEVIHRKREDIYISNVVKFRPFKVHPVKNTKSNRPPRPDETDLCLPYLKEEISVISPKILVTLGNTALQSVLEDKTVKIGGCHGTEISYNENTCLFALYHPASVIYNRALSDVYKADLALLSQLLARICPQLST